jgi:hypothetical protein
MALAGVVHCSVYPSGAALTTFSVAMLLAAPGRSSTINGWPRRSPSHWPIKRAMMSAELPAGKPTTNRTFLVG